MCIAELNVSTEVCGHRWYHMVRSCIPGGNLLSCPSKLALEGWEIKCDFCPFCAGWPLDGGEFMLLGSQPHSRSSSFNDPLSRRPSLTTTVAAARRDSKRGSLARADSGASSVSAASTSALGSPVYVASERNRAMNQRVDSYFVALPESVMETQGKAASQGANMWGTGSWSPNMENVQEEEASRRGSNSTASCSSANASAKVVTARAESAWKKAKRRSQDLSKLFR